MSRLLILAAVTAALAACSAETATQSASDSPASVAGAEKAIADAAPVADNVTGVVVETMDAASYTYVRVNTGTREIWAAASRFDVAVGDRVVVPLEMPVENFHSDTLKRDFPMIYFTSQISPEGQAASAASSAGQMPVASHPPRSEGAQVTERIPQPSGGTTVADVWANRKALAGKPVTVRGKVVKYNGGILDKNWIHIQDGTGDAAAKNNDLTVTSTATASLGDVVTVTGVVAVDKDFGAGYAYPVIIEDAKLARDDAAKAGGPQPR
jgi:hypothetical protein